jgi:peptidoglycan/xylan/chitin deacetylase (PgdA/CDA1 family)
LEARRKGCDVVTAILIYHDVVPASARDDSGFPGPVAARYKLTPQQLAAHFDAVAATGIEVGLLDEHGQGPSAAITFDDGGASALVAADALEKRGWRGHFFITTGRIGAPGFLGAAEVVELRARGHVVGSHSHTHPSHMGRLPAASIAQEWRESRAALADLLGQPPFAAAVPGGSLSNAVVDEARNAGFRVLLTSQPTIRPHRRRGMTTLGRYTVWASTPPARAAGYATGARTARARLWVGWQAKALPKRVAPTLYERVRRLGAGSA